MNAIDTEGRNENRRRKRLRAHAVRFAAIAAAFVAGNAHAAISQVVSSPNTAQVSLAAPAPITVGWGVSTTGGTLRSTQGVFRTQDGMSLGTVNHALAKTVGPGMAILTETVRVPETVAVRAKIMGATDIIYERNFDDGGTPVKGSIPLHIAGESSAGFRINNVAMEFGDASPITVTKRGSKIEVKGIVTFSANYAGIPTQSGTATGVTDPAGPSTPAISIRVNGAWQIAGPNPDARNPQFRQLGDEVNHYITGSDPLELKSPPLPTDKPGMYLLRLEIMTPSPDFDEPAVRYYVTAE